MNFEIAKAVINRRIANLRISSLEYQNVVGPCRGNSPEEIQAVVDDKNAKLELLHSVLAEICDPELNPYPVTDEFAMHYHVFFRLLDNKFDVFVTHTD